MVTYFRPCKIKNLYNAFKFLLHVQYTGSNSFKDVEKSAIIEFACRYYANI